MTKKTRPTQPAQQPKPVSLTPDERARAAGVSLQVALKQYDCQIVGIPQIDPKCGLLRALLIQWLAKGWLIAQVQIVAPVPKVADQPEQG